MILEPILNGGFTLDVRIGCAGWNIPKGVASEFVRGGTHLERYSRRLLCTEINSRFYRAHRFQTWQRWAESVPENFQFSLKAPKAITHEGLRRHHRAQLKDFLQQVTGTTLEDLIKVSGTAILEIVHRARANTKVYERIAKRGILWHCEVAATLVSGFERPSTGIVNKNLTQSILFVLLIRASWKLRFAMRETMDRCCASNPLQTR
jgi:hypothetical protein